MEIYYIFLETLQHIKGLKAINPHPLNQRPISAAGYGI